MASASPLLDEIFSLLKEQALVPRSVVGNSEITDKDTLLVIDMQHDFLPGGAFGVAEGDQTVTPIATMMLQFQLAGATVIASRDYHPNDHCSFMENGGPFPPHCVQGSKGAELHPEIAASIQAGSQMDNSKTHVVFKGFSKDVDSFGAIEYAEKEVTEGTRLNPNRSGDHCGNCWTGGFVLKCSNLTGSANAPPDVMAIYDKKTIGTVLGDASAVAASGGRIFVVGLALDFCVLDTALNAAKAGYENVSIVADCSRAAHISGIGKFGSGFLTDPADIAAQLKEAGVAVTTRDQLSFTSSPPSA